MTIMVPKSSVEDFSKPRSSEFPEGTWYVDLDLVRERPFPDFVAANVAAGKNTGYASEDGEILSLQFGSGRNPETGETTNQKLFVDLVVRDGATTIAESIPEASWQMQRSATLLALLATAAGATEDVEYEGKTYVTITDGFLEALRNGEYDGRSFGVVTWHRRYARKTDAPGEKSGVEVGVREIFQAV